LRTRVNGSIEAAVALHYAYYKFRKIHGTIRCAAAMKAGVECSEGTVAELVETIEGK
jgi:hypothetical protein